MAEHQADPPTGLPRVVLDTNAALDALLFADRGMAAVLAAIEGGRLRWVACPCMRDELARTLGSPALVRWSPDVLAVLARWDALAQVLPAPAGDPQLRCRDPDDQVFLDLALATGASTLLTKDRDLLVLARRAARRKLLIQRPADWAGPPLSVTA